jgi:hypothetical protein
VIAVSPVTMSSASANGTPYRAASGTATLDFPTPDAPQTRVTDHDRTAGSMADHHSG